MPPIRATKLFAGKGDYLVGRKNKRLITTQEKKLTEHEFKQAKKALKAWVKEKKEIEIGILRSASK